MHHIAIIKWIEADTNAFSQKYDPTFGQYDLFVNPLSSVRCIDILLPEFQSLSQFRILSNNLFQIFSSFLLLLTFRRHRWVTRHHLKSRNGFVPICCRSVEGRRVRERSFVEFEFAHIQAVGRHGLRLLFQELNQKTRNNGEKQRIFGSSEVNTHSDNKDTRVEHLVG